MASAIGALSAHPRQSPKPFSRIFRGSLLQNPQQQRKQGVLRTHEKPTKKRPFEHKSPGRVPREAAKPPFNVTMTTTKAPPRGTCNRKPIAGCTSVRLALIDDGHDSAAQHNRVRAVCAHARWNVHRTGDNRETTDTCYARTPSACTRTHSCCTTPLVLAHHLCSEELEPRQFDNSTIRYTCFSPLLIVASSVEREQLTTFVDPRHAIAFEF